MSGSVFRSPEDWKSALLTLPDNSYFELMRSVFGNIKTPFNKQRLVDDLESFLRKKDIQETIAAYIDENDARIIAAVALLGEPVPGELETFFAGEFSFAELRGCLLNLEERLILYRFQGRDPATTESREAGAAARRLALNPLLEPALSPFIGEGRALFPSQELSASAMRGAGKTGLGDDRILAALFAFVAGEGDFFKIEGGLKKKVLDEGKSLFRGLDLEALLGGLQTLGLLRQSAEDFPEGLVLDESRLRHFKALSHSERRVYLAAGIWVGKRSPSLYSRSSVRSLAGFMNALMALLETDRQYPRQTLVRLANMLERSESPGWGARGGLLALDRGSRLEDADFFDSILEALRLAGLLDVGGDGAYFRNAPGERGAARDAAVIAMDTAFSCILYPEIAFADALSLASFSLVRETGATVRFELTRESVVRGFDLGLDADFMLALLDRLSGDQVEQNLRWTVKDWETRYSEVSLFQGVTLILAEDRRYLAGAEPVASLIKRTLAPGVYLLSAEEKGEAIQALRRAGIDIVAQPTQAAQAGLSEAGLFAAGAATGRDHGASPYPPLAEAPRLLGCGFTPPPGNKGASGAPAPDPLRAGRCKERFRSALEKLPFPKDEREELSARIERRMILCESQLTAPPALREKLEARGLDYVGKTSIAKQAIASKQLIEIVWSGQRGEENRAIGLPNALRKSGGETLLALKPVPSGDLILLPLGKIGLLRRVKQSLFGE